MIICDLYFEGSVFSGYFVLDCVVAHGSERLGFEIGQLQVELLGSLNPFGLVTEHLIHIILS